MSYRRCIILLTLILTSLMFNVSASAVETITFEEIETGGNGTANVNAVLDFYGVKGIIFRALVIDFSKGIAIPNFAHSGTKGIETCYGVEFCTRPIEMTFTAPQQRVKLFVGFDMALVPGFNYAVVMRGFNSAGAQVTQFTAPLNPNSVATPVQTPLAINAAGASITRVTVGLEIDGAPGPTNGLVVDDVEFDVAGPPPPCKVSQNPVASISSPKPGTTVQFNQFILALNITSDDPFVKATLTDDGPGPGETRSMSFSGFRGSYGPTSMVGLLFPGANNLTLTVKDCLGSTKASTNINFGAIAPDTRFKVMGFEVSQVIQEVQNSVTLIADKPTIVRVYPRIAGSTSQINKLRGILFAYRPLNAFFDRGLQLPGSVRSLNAIDVNQSIDLDANRQVLNRGLNFQLPADWLSEGFLHFEVSFEIEGDSVSPSTIPCDGCGNSDFRGPVFVNFATVPPLLLRIVGLRYTTGTPPLTFSPSAADFNLLQSWVRRAYPTAFLLATNTTATSSNTWPFDCNAANSQLASIRATEVDGGIHFKTHYIGLVSNGAGFMRGCSGVPSNPDPSVVASGPTGSPASAGFGGDTDASFGDWYGGHELAHEFGRHHPGVCLDNSSDDSNFPNPNGLISDSVGTFVGIDFGDKGNSIALATLPGVSTPDIMTYCNQPQWLSAYTYVGILQRLRDENPGSIGAPRGGGVAPGGGGGGPSPEVTANEVMVGNFLSIVASVNLTKRTGRIRFIDHVKRATPPAPLQNSSASLRIRNKAGIIIGDFPTWVREDSDIPKGQDRTALIQMIIPFAPSIARLELLLYGEMLDYRIVSAHAPSLGYVKLLTPQQQPRGNLMPSVLSWTAADADRDPLTYLVQISADGQTWETKAVGLLVSSLALTEDQLEGKKFIRVIANDGFNVSKPALFEIGRP